MWRRNTFVFCDCPQDHTIWWILEYNSKMITLPLHISCPVCIFLAFAFVPSALLLCVTLGHHNKIFFLLLTIAYTGHYTLRLPRLCHFDNHRIHTFPLICGEEGLFLCWKLCDVLREHKVEVSLPGPYRRYSVAFFPFFCSIEIYVLPIEIGYFYSRINVIHVLHDLLIRSVLFHCEDSESKMIVACHGKDVLAARTINWTITGHEHSFIVQTPPDVWPHKLPGLGKNSGESVMR